MIKTLWQDFKAWRRGEKRIAPRNVRGRVYERKNGDNAPAGRHQSKAAGVAVLKARVIRLDGTTEEIEVNNG